MPGAGASPSAPGSWVRASSVAVPGTRALSWRNAGESQMRSPKGARKANGFAVCTRATASVAPGCRRSIGCSRKGSPGGPTTTSRSWRLPIGEATPMRIHSTRHRARSSCSANSSPPRPRRCAAHPTRAPSRPSPPTFPNGARQSSPSSRLRTTGRRNRALGCAQTARGANQAPTFPQAVAEAKQSPNPPATSRFACSASIASHASIRHGATCPRFRDVCRRSSRSTPRTPTREASRPATW